MKKKQKKGFALIIAIVITSSVLIIGGGVMTVAVKENIFSSIGKESIKALYAADSGAECILYWDKKRETPRDGTGSPPTNPVICDGNDISLSWLVTDTSPVSATTNFQLNFSNGSCADVTITKDRNAIPDTIVVSKGYNVNCVDSKKVERAVEVRYNFW